MREFGRRFAALEAWLSGSPRETARHAATALGSLGFAPSRERSSGIASLLSAVAAQPAERPDRRFPERLPGVSGGKRVVPFPKGERAPAHRVLLLQGPVGPFFAALSSAFAEAGYDVDRVRFNSGDRMFSSWSRDPSRRVIDYREGEEAWPAWLRAMMTRNRYDVVVMFGGERPAHVAAREVAKTMKVPVVCLEEGYVRSGFVTVEETGNNARSPLAGDLPNQNEPRREIQPLKARGFAWMCLFGFLYFGLRNLYKRGLEPELYHKERPSWVEVPRWALNFWHWLCARLGFSSDDRTLSQRLANELAGRYDIVPLQVADDAQLRGAAAGWTNSRLIEETIESFAYNAPKDRHLVFKIHPLERGHTRDHKLVRALAERWEVGERVHCLFTGSLADLCTRGRGMIVINSTSGLSAIAHGIPLLVMGHALFRHPKLVQCGSTQEDIDRFWTNDFVPERSLRNAYRSWLVSRSLVAGDFYDQRVRAKTARNVAARALEIAFGPERRPDAAARRAGEVVSLEDARRG